MLFQNSRGQAGLRLRLRGPVGNPHGVGAVVRLRPEQGTGQVFEIHAGSGYWSQDGAVLVLPMSELGQRVSVRWPGGKTVQFSLPAAGQEVSVGYSGAVRVVR